MENEHYNKMRVLNSNWLKLIAIVAMTIDHVTWLLYPGMSHDVVAIILHVIGRLTFPIMAYMICEGYHYTHDRKKYAIRILIFALISHVPYMMQSMAFKEYGWLSLIPFATGTGINRFLNQASVLWSYFIGLIMLMVVDNVKLKAWIKVVIIVLLAAIAFCSDWSSVGALIILFCAKRRDKPLEQLFWFILFVTIYGVVYAFTSDWLYGVIMAGTLFAVPIIMLYNGKRGNNQTINKIMKWVFYIYYPLHLLVIGIIGIFIK